MRSRGGAKIYGPYQHGQRWRVVTRGGGAEPLASFATREEAQRAIDSFRAASSERTVAQAVEAYLADRKDELRSSSHLAYEFRLGLMLGAGDWALERLTPAKAQRLYDTLRSKVAVDTHRGALVYAKTFGRWLEKKGWLRANPFAKVEGRGARKKGKPQLRLDEARRFYAVALEQARAGDPRALAALLCLVLGMRSGEVLALTPRDIDDQGRLLWIVRGKTDRARRHLEVPADLAPLLVDRARDRIGRMFPHLNRWLWGACERMCDLAGVPVVNPHGLRGTQATLAMRAGATSQLVAAALGHESFATTAAHYARPEAVEAAQAGRLMALVTETTRPVSTTPNTADSQTRN